MRVNFREIVERFGHIDGSIVRAEASFSGDGRPSSACVVVRFYAWWEHPLFLAAREAGTTVREIERPTSLRSRLQGRGRLSRPSDGCTLFANVHDAPKAQAKVPSAIKDAEQTETVQTARWINARTAKVPSCI